MKPDELRRGCATNTHRSLYGGYELARCAVEGIKANVPELATYLAKDVGSFDPSKPDPFEKVGILRCPVLEATQVPAGI